MVFAGAEAEVRARSQPWMSGKVPISACSGAYESMLESRPPWVLWLLWLSLVDEGLGCGFLQVQSMLCRRATAYCATITCFEMEEVFIVMHARMYHFCT